MKLDASARQILDLMAAAGHPTLDTLPSVEARAAARAGFTALQTPKPEVSLVRDLNASGPHGEIPLRLYRPAGADAASALPALMYFHGGGFVIGDIELYDSLCRQISNASGCAVVSVDYRLAPEHKFPAAVDDVHAATRWIAAHAAELKLDPARLGVGGDSAGGNLAAVTSLLARDAGKVPALRFQLLIYPVTDFRGGSESHQQNGEGYFLTRKLMDYFHDHYLRGVQDENDWRASPLLATNHAGLPPAYVLICGFDPLRDEGVAYAQKLRDAGVKVTQRNFDGQIHGLVNMDGVLPEAQVAIREIGAAMRAALLD